MTGIISVSGLVFDSFFFLSERACPGMQTLVSFLTKRVRSPDKDDLGKLKRGLRYLKGSACNNTSTA